MNERDIPKSDPYRHHFLVVLWLFFFLGNPLTSMAQTHSEYTVQWIGMFPGDKKASKDLGDHLSRIVFGKKDREMMKPFSVLASDQEHFWILDQGVGGIFEVTMGEGEWNRSMKRAKQSFPSLVGMCAFQSGDYLLTDSSLDRILCLSGRDLSVFADTLLFMQPTGIAFNGLSGEIWVVETGAHRISVLDKKGNRIRTIGGRGKGAGLFNYPTFIWIDGQGKVYVVDSMNFRVQVFDATGEALLAFGSSGDASGNMARPKGVATDSHGHIYVADALFHVVQIFDEKGSFLHSFGTQGSAKGEFWMPSGIYIDERDRIYVADTYNSRVQIFQLIKN